MFHLSKNVFVIFFHVSSHLLAPNSHRLTAPCVSGMASAKAPPRARPKARPAPKALTVARRRKGERPRLVVNRTNGLLRKVETKETNGDSGALKLVSCLGFGFWKNWWTLLSFLVFWLWKIRLFEQRLVLSFYVVLKYHVNHVTYKHYRQELFHIVLRLNQLIQEQYETSCFGDDVVHLSLFALPRRVPLPPQKRWSQWSAYRFVNKPQVFRHQVAKTW